MIKKAFLLFLSLIFILNSISFVSFAVGLAEGEGALDVYKRLDAAGLDSFFGSYATASEALTAINADNTANAYFTLKLNEDIVYPNITVSYTRGIGERTITIDGRDAHQVLTTEHHNGIIVGSSGQNINLNLSNLTFRHASSGSAIQYFAHGTLTISNSDIIVDGTIDYNNYAVINTICAEDKKMTVNILNSTITCTRVSSVGEASVIRTGNDANTVEINIDGSTITSTDSNDDIIYVNASTQVDINVTNSTMCTYNGNIIYGYGSTSKVNINLGNSMFYTGCSVNGEGVLNYGTIITDPDAAIKGNSTFSVGFSGFTSIGGYNKFPELVITEVHLESINVESGAGPFNGTYNWTAQNLTWWTKSGTHPTSQGTLGGDFFRYIEVYNASSSRIDLFDYKLIIDTNALTSDNTVNELKLEAGATIGAITNPSSAVIQPGETAILYLYNSNDLGLGCTVENFKGYYKWRYNGADSSLAENGMTPAARDVNLVVNLDNTLVIAVNDICANIADTKLGDFNNNSIYYGLAMTDVRASEARAEWTSWALWEHYIITSANQQDQSTYNFLYGIDASADIREGRRMNEARITYNCNPGLLQEIQKLNFQNSDGVSKEAPEITITEINNVTKVAGSADPGYYDYFEVANISADTINIFDYCLFQRYNITASAIDFSLHWFDRVSYLVPGDYGDIQSFSSRTETAPRDYNITVGPYTGTNRKVALTNPTRAEGTLAPGKTAILWMYDAECYEVDNGNGGTRSLDFDDFRDTYEAATGKSLDGTLIVAISGFRNQESDLGNLSLGISNSSCSLFGIGKISNFNRESDSEVAANKAANANHTYPEIKKESLTFSNPNNSVSGFSILKCECVVFMYASMINAGTKDQASLGTNVAYQYAAAYVNGAALRFAGFLSTVFPDGYYNEGGEKVRNSVVTDEWSSSPNSLLEIQNTLIQSFVKNSFSVTYNANTGTGSNFVQFAYAGEAISLSNGGEFTKSGYYLIGWSTVSGIDNVNGSYYKTGQSLTFSADTTLYAVWSAAPASPTFTVTIPATMEFTDRNTAVLEITAEIAYFSENDYLNITVLSTDDDQFLLKYTGEGSVAPLPYTLTNETTGNTINNNDTIMTVTNSSAKSVVIFAECEPPKYSGNYSDTLTFQFIQGTGISS